MIYLSSFKISDKRVRNPNLYPYNVFAGKIIEPFVFAPITIFYGNNGSGKSTLLNLIARKFQNKDIFFNADVFTYTEDYFRKFLNECTYDFGEDDYGRKLKLPPNCEYIKSEDILHEIIKIEHESALEDGYVFDHMRREGLTKAQAKEKLHTPVMKGGSSPLANILFNQEKYSNGETAMQLLYDDMMPDTLYLMDEPEVSLSPQNQVKLANQINKYARLLGCQFIISTHSPFMLGTLNAKIYNLDLEDMAEVRWTELENVKYFYDFFRKHKEEFE